MRRPLGPLAAAMLLALVAACDKGGDDGGPGTDADLSGDGGVFDSDTDGGETGADTEPDGEGGETVLLANESPCVNGAGPISPDPGEEGHLFAARLTPETYPFVVETVRYHLVTETEGCNAGLAHRVELYVTTDTAPPAEPEPVLVINVPAEPELDLEHLASHPLSPPLTLTEGQHLFIAVEMAGTEGGDHLCVGACDSPGAEPDRNYWSAAAASPYAWVTMSSIGLDVNAEIFVLGKPE